MERGIALAYFQVVNKNGLDSRRVVEIALLLVVSPAGFSNFRHAIALKALALCDFFRGVTDVAAVYAVATRGPSG